MELAGVRKHVLICNGATCLEKGGKEVAQAIRTEIRKRGLNRDIHTTLTRCNGRCIDGCTVITYPDGTWYKNMTPEQGAEMIRRLLKGDILSASVSYFYNENRFTAWGSTADREVASSITPANERGEG